MSGFTESVDKELRRKMLACGEAWRCAPAAPKLLVRMRDMMGYYGETRDYGDVCYSKSCLKL